MSVKGILAVMALSATSLATFAAEYPVSEAKVMIPTPPSGQRWILNDEYSDEFNGDKLDGDKWLDYHPTWIGRAPGLFESKNVSVADGCLKLGSSKMDTPVSRGRGDNPSVFDISCAAVVSKGETAHYGYYEARVKANKTSLSTTYWLSRGGGNHPVAGNQPEGVPDGTFGQELDICETIGRTGTSEEGWMPMSSQFYTGMNSNVHCWVNPKGGTRTDLAIKHIDRAIPEDGSVLSDNFNIYGCWWIDEGSAEFFLNNISNGGKKDFVSRTGQEFYLPKPMGVNIVVETYSWIPKPTDEDLADPMKNTSYYDWVRHYVLVDIDQTDNNPAPAQSEIFEDYIYFAERDAVSDEFSLIYSAPEDRSLLIEIYTASGKRVGSEIYSAYAGFGADEYDVDKAKLSKGEEYTVVAYLLNEGAKKSKGYLAGDSFTFVAQ